MTKWRSDDSPELKCMSKNDQTDFGFSKVSSKEKTAKVADVFHSVAQKYDLMNDLMSLGLHRLWKRFAISIAQFRPGHKVLDLAGGTGDLSARIQPIVGETGRVILSDINFSMLRVGRDRLLDSGKSNTIEIVQADAEALPFSDNYFDRVIIGFGLRNITKKENALIEMRRVLKPGGCALVLEFSKVKLPVLNKLYDFYSFSILPKMGQLVANDADSYRYLAESIRMHPDQESLKHLMQNAGFEDCDYHNVTGGMVAVHRGYKYG